jgi:uncharacterized protein YgiM (DUF1202 family)
LAVSAGIVAIGTVVSNSVVTRPAPQPAAQTVALERPSYLSELPERTERALQAGLIEPPAVRGPADDPLPVRTAALEVAPALEPEFVAAEVRPGAERVRVTAAGLNVRSGPSNDSSTLFVLRRNEAVEVAEAEGRWVRIQTESGATGWAYRRYLAPTEQ